MDDLPKDRYCSPLVTMETASAFCVELEPLAGMRTQFMFWDVDAPYGYMKFNKRRVRDLRPGDEVEFEGFRRAVKSVVIYR